MKSVDVNDNLFIVKTSRQGFANIWAAIWTSLDLCFINLINVALPELISDENFLGDRVALLCNGTIKTFWLSSEVLNQNCFPNESPSLPPLFNMDF